MDKPEWAWEDYDAAKIAVQLEVNNRYNDLPEDLDDFMHEVKGILNEALDSYFDHLMEIYVTDYVIIDRV